MTENHLRYVFVLTALLCFVAVGYTAKAENQEPITHTVRLELNSASVPVVYPMRQEFVDSFERSVITPWTTGGTAAWVIRDTTNTYGPDTCAVSGYRYAGVPTADTVVYPGNETDSLSTPTIDLTGWDSLFFSFSYWADFEGSATNFDGGIIQISADNGATWVQIDSLAQGHLNPTYDQQLVGTGQIGTPWAYCYDRQYWVAVSSMDLIGLGYAATGNQIKIRFVFDSDDLSGGQGWFIDDVRIADTPPPDLQPPLIVHTPLPDTIDTLSNYTVTATVTDGGSGVDPDSVILHYEIESGPTVDVTMAAAGGNTYEADIPAQSWNTDIWYQVMAADNAGNWAQTAIYNFEVTNALTIIYDDGQPWFAPDTLPDGYFTRFQFTDVGIDSGQIHQLKILFEAPGELDVRIYEATAGQPGTFIDSIAGIVSPGYDWYTVDLDPLNIQTANPFGIVVGYVEIPPAQIGILRDQTLDHPGNMWNLTGAAWTAGASGDFLMRLKVIPLEGPGIVENTNRPFSTFTLAQIAPNPVKKTGMIEYSLPSAQRVSLEVYDVAGKLIRTLVNEVADAGTHQVAWDGRDAHGNQVANGVYLYRLQGENESATKKLIFVR